MIDLEVQVDLLKHHIHELEQDNGNYLDRLEEKDEEIADLKKVAIKTTALTSMNEYQLLARRTHPTDLTRRDLMLNAALGSTGEAGELADMIKKHVYHNHELPFDEVGYELGDMLWYISLMAELFGFTLQEVADMNIEKLRKRYPEGFNSVDSIKRVDAK